MSEMTIETINLNFYFIIVTNVQYRRCSLFLIVKDCFTLKFLDYASR